MEVRGRLVLYRRPLRTANPGLAGRGCLPSACLLAHLRAAITFDLLCLLFLGLVAGSGIHLLDEVGIQIQVEVVRNLGAAYDACCMDVSRCSDCRARRKGQANRSWLTLGT